MRAQLPAGEGRKDRMASFKPKRCLRVLAGLRSPSPIAKAVPPPAEDAATLAFLGPLRLLSLSALMSVLGSPR